MKFKEGMVIHCNTKEKAERLLKDLDSKGWKWLDGGRLNESDLYYFYKETTCYRLHEGNSVTYGYVEFFLGMRAQITEYDKLYLCDSDEVRIITKGLKTTATLWNSGKYVKHAIAKCNPTDTFDFNIGAKLAFERLMGIEITQKNEATPKVREVKRKAKVGEWVKIVNSLNSFGNYKNGDVLKIISFENNSIAYYGKDPDKCLYIEEYVVLENYTPVEKTYTQSEVDTLIKTERERIRESVEQLLKEKR